jgi:predicted nucleic acid-binding protein
MADKQTYVLDTSALLALRGDEPGAGDVERLLREADSEGRRVLVSFMTRMELLYMIRREEDEGAAIDALRLVNSFCIEWVSCEDEILEAAAMLKSRGGLSLADCWIGATALVRNAVLVHKDPEFAAFRDIRQRRIG